MGFSHVAAFLGGYTLIDSDVASQLRDSFLRTFWARCLAAPVGQGASKGLGGGGGGHGIYAVATA